MGQAARGQPHQPHRGPRHAAEEDLELLRELSFPAIEPAGHPSGAKPHSLGRSELRGSRHFETDPVVDDPAQLRIFDADLVQARLEYARGDVDRDAVLGIAVFGGLRLFFEYVVPQEYRDYNALLEIDLVEHPSHITLKTLDDVVPLTIDQRNNRFDAIKQRGSLHVGYLQEALPFAYLRGGAELVGMDVDMMIMLANDLGVGVDFVSLSREEITDSLNSGRVDIVIGGLFASPDRALDTALSEPYMDASISLVVRDHRRREFSNWEAIRQRRDLKLAVVDLPFLVMRVEKYLPDVRVERIEDPTQFLTADEDRFDAMLYSAEAGSAWTLLFPRYSVVVPEPNVISVPVVFALPADAARWNRYVNAWISLNKTSRKVERLYDYWILGQGAGEHKRRWSVVHDILGWDRSRAEARARLVDRLSRLG